MEELFTCLEQLNSVTVELQRENLKLAEARDLFDGVIDLFPSMAHHLGENADIVTDVLFESGILKVQRGKEHLLTTEEKRKLRMFEKTTNDAAAAAPANEEDNLTFAQRLLKRRRTECPETLYKEDINYVLPTSNICERLFSRAKLILTGHRAGTLPVNFEMLLFLKMNQDFWNINTLHLVMIE